MAVLVIETVSVGVTTIHLQAEDVAVAPSGTRYSIHPGAVIVGELGAALGSRFAGATAVAVAWDEDGAAAWEEDRAVGTV